MIPFYVIRKKTGNWSNRITFVQANVSCLQGINVRSHYSSLMFGSHNEDHILKVQTKENVDISKYQFNVTSQALSGCMM